MGDPRDSAVEEHAAPPGSGVQATWPGPPFTNPVRLAVVDSTNRYLRDAARSGAPEGAVVLASEQVAGRGRRGRTWSAPRGGAMLCSVLFRPPRGAEWLHLVPSAVALAARDAAAACAGVECSLKWPNDLLVGEQKVGGILAELADDGRALVVGVGVNVAWPASFPPPGEPTALLAGATTLERAAGRPVALAELEERFLEATSLRHGRLASRAGRDETAAAYREACATLGRQVRVVLETSAVEGRAVQVADDGRLVVELAGGRRRAFDAGDVVHLR